MMDHPFYAVTDEKGAFEIKGLPAGKYEIEIWHETFKSVSILVEVAAGDEKTVDFKVKDKTKK